MPILRAQPGSKDKFPRPLVPFVVKNRQTVPKKAPMVCSAAKKDTASETRMKFDQYREPSKVVELEEASLRAEAEAPFRSLRIVLFGFGVVSAVLATFFSIPTLIGSLAGAPNAKILTEALQDLGINVGALGVCGFLLNQELQAREKQMARLMREDKLGACQLELSNGKVLRLAQLRGAVRPVVVVGTHDQVAAAVQAAEPFREKLMERGVMLVGIPMYENQQQSSSGDSLRNFTQDDLRWRAKPVRVNDWKEWFDEQVAASGKETSQGLYVGLRLDGRVRASGLGCPPWDIFAAQLPPTDGFFGGLLDGLDGKV